MTQSIMKNEIAHTTRMPDSAGGIVIVYNTRGVLVNITAFIALFVVIVVLVVFILWYIFYWSRVNIQPRSLPREDVTVQIDAENQRPPRPYERKKTARDLEASKPLRPAYKETAV
ncbi:uncharacterized protein NEMAJ01_0025 [Nematocida major]|uniref:uncharacterized protein n=1 Tax=Nematocida major TaxID=1912982 RepID=UPI0020075882|nr:uncharacterized protein NEMAJ01_0025 [Nematocida major]KAH9385129.1 hypothetical protein NEMAJ01_0025 [Nematocida major]